MKVKYIYFIEWIDKNIMVIESLVLAVLCAQKKVLAGSLADGVLADGILIPPRPPILPTN